MSGIPSWAVPGRKVVCINARWDGITIDPANTLPVEGEVYTVRSVVVLRGIVSIRLEEIINPDVFTLTDGWGESSFRLWRFRPVHTIETDLKAHFRALLDVPVPQGVDA